MTESFDYESEANHIEKRLALSDELQLALTDLTTVCGERDQWPQHQRFAGEVEFWLQIHNALRGAANELPERCAAWLLLLDEPAARKKHLTRLSQLGGQLIHHTHTHHHVEEHHFFPLFKRTYPTLKHHIALLDGDHRVLTVALDQLEIAFNSMPVIKDEEDKKQQSLLAIKSEELYRVAKNLQHLFSRHLSDEEEICIPALLQM